MSAPGHDHAGGAPGPRHHDGHDHDHGGAHDHDHGAALRSAGAEHAWRLWCAFGLVVAFAVVQVVVGLATHSLALVSDAGHMATDALGLGMALAAVTLAGRGSRTGYRTFGWYRLEILAALANSVLLLGVGAWVVIEALRRIGDPPHIDGPVVLVVGALGLAVNIVGFLLLRAGSKESLNVEGAYLEVLADLAGSVAVVVGAALIWATGWRWIDPVLGAAIGLWIAPRAVRLGRKALRILTEAASEHHDPAAIGESLRAVTHVVDVHDLHVWTLTSGMDSATVHLMVASSDHLAQVLTEARAVLSDRYGIAHATVQVEPADHGGCADVSW